MVQQNAWHITHRAWNKRICMAAGRYPRQTSAFMVNRRKLPWFSHVCRHDTLQNNILEGTVDGSRRRGKPHKLWKDNIKEWTGQSKSRLLRIAADVESRWAVIVTDASVGELQQRLGVMGISLIESKVVHIQHSLVSWLSGNLASYSKISIDQ